MRWWTLVEMGVLQMLIACDGDPLLVAGDTGNMLAGERLTVLMVGADGTAWMAGKQGRAARWNPGWGFQEEPALGLEAVALLGFEGELWAVLDRTALRYHGEGWLGSGLDTGVNFYGMEGSPCR